MLRKTCGAYRGNLPTTPPCTAEHPLYEAFFNSVNAWSLMFLPVILTDKQAQGLGRSTQWGLWLGIFFVTNVFFVPFLALRAAVPTNSKTHTDTTTDTAPLEPSAAPWARWVGVTALTVLGISAAWAVLGRPEYGVWDARWTFALDKFNTDRVFWAFVLDCGLYSVWQAMLLERAASGYRFVPFVGLAAWLCAGMPEKRRE